ncbi:VanW family protein [Cellulomonas uda]|uniref:VanW domain-containing protein n=1 Tax=Cellulomonas uda TaxID=1714 RepID=A0A4Y3KAT0_CELUD|nr:VanW family protein [Cellulomonas uda]NII66327.1 vancomycin resistance protein VanW [Cellulomonas uda]GEA81113.1 VanW domain-containing protein [Cellulomonas uda]
MGTRPSGTARVTGPVRERARESLGPAVRRLRREWQWRQAGVEARLDRVAPDGFAHEVAAHRTPIFRELAGVDRRLQEGKAVNLMIAAGRLDGSVLRPGQRMSFWRLVGRPSHRRGFRDGMVLRQGLVEEGVGGGMCQMTNLLYWMTVHTPLTVVERWRHTYDVFPDNGRTQPFGSGATCSWPVLDLQIENRTDATFRLSLTVERTHLVGAWTSDRAPLHTYEVYEAAHEMRNDLPGVFTRHNVLRRRVLDAEGAEVDDELLAVNQGRLMYQPFLEAGGAG